MSSNDVDLMRMEKEIQGLKGRIREVELQINAATWRLANKLYGVYPGCLVKNKNGDVFQVNDTPLETLGDRLLRQKPWVTAFPRKKNGEFSASWRHLNRDWEVISDE